MEKTSIGTECCACFTHRVMVKRMPKIDHAGVSERLEALRETLGLEKGVFSLSWGLDPSSYSKVIGKDAKPLKVEYALAISEVYGVTMDFIYRGDLSKVEPALRARLMSDRKNRDL